MTKVRYVYATRFIPLTLHYGQIQVQRLDIMEFIKQLNLSLEKLFDELCEKISDKRIISSGIEISQVNLGSVTGLVIVVYAFVEDS